MGLSERTRFVVIALVCMVLVFALYWSIKWGLQSLGVVGWKSWLLLDCIFIYALVREWTVKHKRKLKQPALVWHWLRLVVYTLAVCYLTYNILNYFFG